MKDKTREDENLLHSVSGCPVRVSQGTRLSAMLPRADKSPALWYLHHSVLQASLTVMGQKKRVMGKVTLDC